MMIKSKYTEAIFMLKEEVYELTSSFSLFKNNIKNSFETSKIKQIKKEKINNFEKELTLFLINNKKDFLWSNLIKLKNNENKNYKEKEGNKILELNDNKSKKELIKTFNLTKLLKTEIKELKFNLIKVTKNYQNENYCLLKKKKANEFIKDYKINQSIKRKFSKPNELNYFNKIDLEIKNLQIEIKDNKVKLIFDKLPMFKYYELYYFENNNFYKLFDFEYKKEILFESNKKIFSIIPKGVLNG